MRKTAWHCLRPHPGIPRLAWLADESRAWLGAWRPWNGKAGWVLVAGCPDDQNPRWLAALGLAVLRYRCLRPGGAWVSLVPPRGLRGWWLRWMGQAFLRRHRPPWRPGSAPGRDPHAG